MVENCSQYSHARGRQRKDRFTLRIQAAHADI